MSSITSPPPTRYRFGVFEIDTPSGELRKSGISLRLQSQPFRILLYLAERAGEIVSREELQRHFWKPDTTVDLDRSLAAAVHKIRECLDDSVTSPRFIETIARTGYRFIAPIAAMPGNSDVSGMKEPPRESVSGFASFTPNLVPDPATSAAGAIQGPESPNISTLSELGSQAHTYSEVGIPDAAIYTPGGRISLPLRLLSRRAWLLCGLAGAFSLLTALAGFSLGAHWSPAWTPQIRRVTDAVYVDTTPAMSLSFPGLVTDASRVYFPQQDEGRGDLGEILLTGGESATLALPADLGAPFPDDVSPDGSWLLLRNHLSSAPELPVWIASTAGQTAHQVPGVLAHDSTWMPDGHSILYANGNDLYETQDNGAGKHKWASLSGRAFRMKWSPDGQRLRFTLVDDRTLETSLWEIAAGGSGTHRLLKNWNPSDPVCCGSWTRDGKLYVFQAGDGDHGSLWAVSTGSSWMGAEQTPFRLAEGPLSYSAPVTTRDGRHVLFVGTNPNSELLQLELKTGGFTQAPPFLQGALRVEASPDHQWIAWVRGDDGSLWRSRADGADRARILGSPYKVYRMRWSPDGERLAVMARRPGTPWKIYLEDIRSGRGQMLVDDDDHNEADPEWSDGGKSIIFGRLPHRAGEASLPASLYSVDLVSHKVLRIPGSDGLMSPRISPDWDALAALSEDQTALRLLDLRNGTWRTRAAGHIDAPEWSADGKSIIFLDLTATGQSLLRVNINNGRPVPLASLSGVRAPGVARYTFAGLLPGDVPAVSVPTAAAELYELDLPE